MLKLLIASVLFVQVAPLSELEIKVKVAIAIANAKAETVSTLAWTNYPTAFEKYRTNGQPLVILFTTEGCLPCKLVKDRLELEKIAGVNYATIDVVKDEANARRFFLEGTIIVPQVALFWTEGGNQKHLHLTAEQATPNAVVAATKAAVAPKPVKTSAAATWSWRIERIPAPPGFGWVDIAGDAYYHVTGHHGDYIRAVTSKVDIRGMSRRDLLSLHSLIHSGLPVGRWEGRCYVFMLP